MKPTDPNTPALAEAMDGADAGTEQIERTEATLRNRDGDPVAELCAECGDWEAVIEGLCLDCYVAWNGSLQVSVTAAAPGDEHCVSASTSLIVDLPGGGQAAIVDCRPTARVRSADCDRPTTRQAPEADEAYAQREAASLEAALLNERTAHAETRARLVDLDRQFAGLPTDKELVDLLADALGTDAEYRDRLDPLTVARLVVERLSETHTRLSDLALVHEQSLDKLREAERRLSSALETIGHLRGSHTVAPLLVSDETAETCRRAARACETWAGGRKGTGR
jgi:hypothetical protein